jgi:hypothetical protein
VADEKCGAEAILKDQVAGLKGAGGTRVRYEVIVLKSLASPI